MGRGGIRPGGPQAAADDNEDAPGARETWTNRGEAALTKRRKGDPAASPDTDVVVPVEFSEDSIAAEFTRRHASDHRYTAKWSRWHIWTGSRWAEDETMHVYDRVRRVCRELADAAAASDRERLAAAISSSRTVAAVERLARADRAHASTADQWDADPWLLNTPGGTVDLRTGELRQGRPDDFLTRQTKATPRDVTPALWLTFLDRVTGGDTEMCGFLQRVAGYCLTGDISAHALFFLYGTGGNGKGTFLNTLTNMLGDYSVVAAIDTFTASMHDRHPTELAMLNGPRLVASQETEEGRRWAESRIKQLTGGDPISARFMRGDFFQFRPQFKLVIAGNHKPHLRAVDEAIRRRLHLIPFTQTITAAEKVLGLEEMLTAEWPGILHWAIEGCLAWLECGLRPPEGVRDATSEYFTTEDSFQAWLDECCELGAGYWTSAADLFTSWSEWIADAGEQAGSRKRFAANMESHGFQAKRASSRKAERGFSGLHVRLRVQNKRHENVANF